MSISKGHTQYSKIINRNEEILSSNVLSATFAMSFSVYWSWRKTLKTRAMCSILRLWI